VDLVAAADTESLEFAKHCRSQTDRSERRAMLGSEESPPSWVDFYKQRIDLVKARLFMFVVCFLSVCVSRGSRFAPSSTDL
jgi:hypothetical protein